MQEGGRRASERLDVSKRLAAGFKIPYNMTLLEIMEKVNDTEVPYLYFIKLN